MWKEAWERSIDWEIENGVRQLQEPDKLAYRKESVSEGR